MMNNFNRPKFPRIPPPRGLESGFNIAEISGTLSDFDESDASVYSNISESASHDHRAGALRTIPSKHVPSHLLMVSLLEHLCSIYEPDPSMKDELFKAICNHLAKLKVMSPLCYVDELETIRSHYKKVFTVMLDSARLTVHENHKDRSYLKLMSTKERLAIMFQPRISHKQPGFKIADVFDMNASRYRQEFIELKCLGRGGFGSVYKARHKLDGCLYAIKKIQLGQVNPEMWMKILREVRVLANLNHPNVVGYNAAWLQQECIAPAKVRPVGSMHNRSRSLENKNGDDSDIIFQHSEANAGGDNVLLKSVNKAQCAHSLNHVQDCNGKSTKRESLSCDHKNTGGQCSADSYWYTGDLLQDSKTVLYIQMQLCTSTLKDWIHRQNSQCNTGDLFECVNEIQALKALKQILWGTEYIHNQGLIHRDIKPRNIFLYGDDFTIKIGDFGLARDDILEDSTVNVMPLVDFQFEDLFDVEDYTTGVGTSIYGAPEQLSGHDYDSKTDIFSIGITTFEMFHPFLTEMERAQTLTKLRSGVVPEQFQVRWPQISKAILAMVNADPKLRPTAKEVLECEIFLTKDEIIAKLTSRLEAQADEIAHLRSYIVKLESLK